MPNNRKPIPKTQQQLSKEQHVSYYPQAGNPNDFIETPVNNRALNTSWKGDNTKPFSIGIQDIDESIFYYFQNVIKPTVIQNGSRLSVPIIYGSPEKWKSFQKDGYYRDQKGKIMAPLIMFKRTDITKNRQIANKLDANNPNLFQVFTKTYDPKNAYDNFKVLNNRVPQKQYYAVIMPDYVTVTYEVAVFTYYVEQLNKIVEAMEYSSDAYWGDPQRFQFKAMIDSFGFQTELAQDDDRIVRSTFNIKINGYIVPDTIQKDVTAINKFSSKARTIFGLEASSLDPAPTNLRALNTNNRNSTTFIDPTPTDAPSSSTPVSPSLGSFSSAFSTVSVGEANDLLLTFTGGGGGGSVNTGSLLTTASFSDPNLTFTKGDGSTFQVNLSTLTVVSASYALSASFATTASYINGGVF